MNQVKLSGTICYEPDLKHPASGKPYLRNQICVTTITKKDRFSFVAFVDQAKRIAQMNQGDTLSIEAALRTGSYEKNGQTVQS